MKLTFVSKVKGHVISYQYKRCPIENIRKAATSHPRHGLVDRLTGTFPTHKMFVEKTHQLLCSFLFNCPQHHQHWTCTGPHNSFSPNLSTITVTAVKYYQFSSQLNFWKCHTYSTGSLLLSEFYWQCIQGQGQFLPFRHYHERQNASVSLNVSFQVPHASLRMPALPAKAERPAAVQSSLLPFLHKAMALYCQSVLCKSPGQL